MDQADHGALVGTVIAGRYAIESVLGSGGMGVVYRARHLTMNRSVALKLLHAHTSSNKNAALRFEREMQAMSRIEHPSTIRVYDYGTTDGGQLFLAMELVHGKTLADVLREAGANGLPLGRLVAIARQIGKALVAAHAEGVVHRDLKPDNVMLLDLYGERDVVKVLDFGIARFVEGGDDQRLTTEGAVIGTPAYMSPEQVHGTTPDLRTDLYSFGIMLYEMATGAVPFSAPTTLSLLVKHVQDAPPRPSEKASVPPALEALIMQCLEKAPDARPESAAEVVRRLEAIGDRTSTHPPAPAPAKARAKTRAWIAALVALAAVAALVVWLVTRPRPEPSAVVSSPAPAPTPAPAPAEPDPRAPLAAIFAEAREPDVPNSAMTRGPPGTLEVLVKAGRLLAGADHIAAYELLTRHADLIKDSVEGQIFLARATLNAVQTPASAEPAALRSVHLCTCAIAYDVLGDVYKAQDLADKAKQAYLDARRSDPDYFPAIEKAVQIALDQRQPHEAQMILDDIVRRRPDFAPARYLHGISSVAVDDTEVAIADFEVAVKQAPQHAEAWLALGQARQKVGLLDSAEEAFCKAKALGLPEAADLCRGAGATP